jgi:surface polysaccharide O-acyltransferase-like enzyme
MSFLTTNQVKDEKNRERNYGLDLLRIISMLMVVVLHIISHGSILEKANILTLTGASVWFLRSLCFCAVNCYALISGYVGIKSRHKYTNIISLWLQVLFYSVIIAVADAVYVFATSGAVNIKSLIKGCFPFLFGQYWYFTAYVCLFFFIPILNHIINTVPRQNLKLYSVFAVLIFCGVAVLYDKDIGLQRGCSFTWLAIVYLIGGYIAKYDPLEKLSCRKSLLAYFVCSLLAFLSVAGVSFATNIVFGSVRYANVLFSYNAITVVGASVFLLNFFKQLKVKPTFEKTISLLAKTSFGVYLIHENVTIRAHFIKGQFAVLLNYPMVTVLLIVAAALLIYAICTAIDFLRLGLFKILRVDKISAFIEKTVIKIFIVAFNILHISLANQTDGNDSEL